MAGRSRWPTTCSTLVRRHLVSTVGHLRRDRAGQRPRRGCDRAGRPRAPPASRRSSTSTWRGPMRRESHERAGRPSSPSCSASCALRPRRATGRGRGLPGRRARRSPTSRFRPIAEGLVEDYLVRGVHPMVGRRLNLWRLRDFDIIRLDAPEDVLLYRCIGEGERRRPASGRAGAGPRTGRRPRRSRASQFPGAGRAGRSPTASRRSGAARAASRRQGDRRWT